MKTISVVIPCYNDEKTIVPQYKKICEIFETKLPTYNYEIIFADDCSCDNTWDEISKVCEKDKRVKGIHNTANFGVIRNLFCCLKYGHGDAVFMLMGDMQEPVELLPEFISHWEAGAMITVGQKTGTTESAFKKFARRSYYRLISKFALKPQISNFTGYGLYDKSFIEILNGIDDMQPYIKGIVSEFGGRNVEIVPYKLLPSTRKSNFNFMRNYDYAMAGITGYAKNLLRLCTFAGVGVGILAFGFSIYTLINKLLNWNDYPMGIPTLMIGLSFLSAVQLFFMGIMGEYILSINERTMKRPLVIADQRINWDIVHEEVG